MLRSFQESDRDLVQKSPRHFVSWSRASGTRSRREMPREAVNARSC